MRWKCTVAYDGTEFEGWQSQPGGNTIQDFLERRLAVLMGAPVRIHASGRTDSGVHARAQVFHFDGHWPHGPETLLKALKCGYPRSIQVTQAEPVDAAFHGRYSVIGKRYTYHFYEGDAPPFETLYTCSLSHRRLDDAAMHACAATLIGVHDFSAFAARHRDVEAENPIKDLRRLDLVRHGPRITLTTEASGYLYKMVRSLAGALADAGFGKLSPADFTEILASRTRTNRVPTAPAEGLFLDRVFYPGDEAAMVPPCA